MGAVKLNESSSSKSKGNDGSQIFNAGDMLFYQGDPGGDLYFIQHGQVEIFTVKDDEAITLAEMNPGEIIGVMTCLTSEPRMASARAKTDLLVKKVPHNSIKKVLSALPNWMKIVLKEFTIRLMQMNKVYSDAVLHIKKLEATQLTQVYVGALIAGAFGAVAEYIAIKYEDRKVVVIDDLLDKLEFILNMKREDIDRVFAVILEAGLLKTEIEPEKKRVITGLDTAQKLAYFATFVRNSKHGATKKLVRAKFSNKETRVLSSIVKLAAKLEMNLEKSCKFSVKELTDTLERVTGTKFEREALDKGLKLELLEINGEGDSAEVIFVPVTLGRTVACIEAVRKLSALDQRGKTA